MVARRLTLTARLDRIEAKLPPPVATTREDAGSIAYQAWLDGLTDAELDAELQRHHARMDADPEYLANRPDFDSMTSEQLDEFIYQMSIHPSERGTVHARQNPRRRRA